MRQKAARTGVRPKEGQGQKWVRHKGRGQRVKGMSGAKGVRPGQEGSVARRPRKAGARLNQEDREWGPEELKPQRQGKVGARLNREDGGWGSEGRAPGE